MNVGQLCDRVTQGIIDLPERAVAAVDVGDGDFHQMGGGFGGGEGLDAVADDQNDIRPQFCKCFGERCDCISSCLGAGNFRSRGR